MANTGKPMLTIVFKATTDDQVAEGDRLFASHAAWMAETHYQDGPKALLSYNVSKGLEYSNQLDPTSEPTGKTYFVLNEIYETEAGVVDHWEQAQASWPDFGAMVEWLSEIETELVHGTPIVHSLW